MLLNILQYTGQPTKQRTILPKMPVMLRLRNVALGLYEGFLNGIILESLVFCVYSLRKLLPLFCLPFTIISLPLHERKIELSHSFQILLCAWFPTWKTSTAVKNRQFEILILMLRKWVILMNGQNRLLQVR